jgi:hypothetical protein
LPSPDFRKNAVLGWVQIDAQRFLVSIKSITFHMVCCAGGAARSPRKDDFELQAGDVMGSCVSNYNWTALLWAKPSGLWVYRMSQGKDYLLQAGIKSSAKNGCLNEV